jgi:hypothetical protein
VNGHPPAVNGHPPAVNGGGVNGQPDGVNGLSPAVNGGSHGGMHGQFNVHPWASLELEQELGASGGMSAQEALAASAARQHPAQVMTDS